MGPSRSSHHEGDNPRTWPPHQTPGSRDDSNLANQITACSAHRVLTRRPSAETTCPVHSREARPPFGRSMPGDRSCSALVVSHHLDGLLRDRSASIHSLPAGVRRIVAHLATWRTKRSGAHPTRRDTLKDSRTSTTRNVDSAAEASVTGQDTRRHLVCHYPTCSLPETLKAGPALPTTCLVTEATWLAASSAMDPPEMPCRTGPLQKAGCSACSSPDTRRRPVCYQLGVALFGGHHAPKGVWYSFASGAPDPRARSSIGSAMASPPGLVAWHLPPQPTV
jgi:hypothetical protein